jgi:CPA2 family monovalent cation:H+ antiporter-2
VLFFVSVGMLFDPAVVIEQPWPLLATVLIIVFGKSIAAFAIVRAFGHPTRTALTVSASLAQIGEFSFILAGLGAGLGILPPEGRDLILAGAILSILVNPFLFAAVVGKTSDVKRAAAAEVAAKERKEAGHTVLIGYGRVGSLVAEGARKAGRPLTIVEAEHDLVQAARVAGFEVVEGNAASERVLSDADIETAARLILAIPEGFDAGAIAEKARALNANLAVLARAHSDEEVAHLERHGATHVVMGEREIATRLLAHIAR